MRDTSLDFTKPVRDMTEAERTRAIKRLEEQREEIVYEIEELMKEISKEMRTGRYKARRFKLGKSPNDYSYKK